LYEILGLGSSATLDELKAARRSKAKEAHPDAGGDSAHFRLIQYAFDVLSDSQLRAQYDESLRTASETRSSTGGYVSTAVSVESALHWIAQARDWVPQTVGQAVFQKRHRKPHYDQARAFVLEALKEPHTASSVMLLSIILADAKLSGQLRLARSMLILAAPPDRQLELLTTHRPPASDVFGVYIVDYVKLYREISSIEAREWLIGFAAQQQPAHPDWHWQEMMDAPGIGFLARSQALSGLMEQLLFTLPKRAMPSDPSSPQLFIEAVDAVGRAEKGGCTSPALDQLRRLIAKKDRQLRGYAFPQGERTQPPGWFPDPTIHPQSVQTSYDIVFRWWMGSAWTHVRVHQRSGSVSDRAPSTWKLPVPPAWLPTGDGTWVWWQGGYPPAQKSVNYLPYDSYAG
jgi:curved DNA-binding protein CbpA